MNNSLKMRSEAVIKLAGYIALDTFTNRTNSHLHNVNGSAFVTDEQMNGEIEREPCDYCDMDGSIQNGFHLLGCP